ncbi:MAG: Gfo/Idh/MocA family oxidoreductase [Bacteroidota bacterium]
MWCYYSMRDEAVRQEVPIPNHFNYDQWTGPAPLLPFRGIPHRRWRSFMAYGNGIMGDMCVHYLDAVRWLLDLGWPSRISSHGGIRVQTAADATTTDTQTAIFEYPDQGLNCHWTHRSWGIAPEADWPWAFVLYGDKGVFKADTQKCQFLPFEGEAVWIDALFETDKYPEDQREKGIELHVASATRRHLGNFLEAVEQGKKPVADVEEGYISSAACILANLSYDLGRPLSYDPQARTVPNDQEAQALLARKYRAGWERP